MKILKMRATFGKLQSAELALGEGLNVIEAPNEGGKSTWSAFLRAMLYGINTKERDRQGYLAEKNRYQPWSGAAMEGSVELLWQGRSVTLRRGPKGSTPFGRFEAVYTGTAELVPGLTGDNAGETLTGVPREVFERSAFVGQGGAAIDGAPALEARIAALASSGEEDVSYSQVERRLRDWLNRRKHNKTGLIPRLEEEASALTERLAQARQAARRAAEAQAQIGALTRQKAELEAESAAQQARRDWAQAEQYRAAVRELEKARAELDSLEGETLPDKEALREAQGELAYLNVLAASLKEAKNQVEPARQAVEAAESAAVDPMFPDMDPDQAWRRAGEDAQRARALEKRAGTGLRAVGILFLAAAAVSAVIGALSGRNLAFFVSAALEALAGVQSLLSAGRAEKRRVKAREEILSRYSAAFPDDILARANAYRDKWTAAEEARRGAEAVERSIRDLEGQRRALWDKLLSFVRTFAPEANDPFGASAALSRALGREERLSAARVKAQAAQRLVDSLPAPAGAGPGTPPPPTERNPQQTAAALAAVGGEISRLQGELSHAEGQRTALGDPAELEHGLEEAEEALTRRRGEYRALELALEALSQANGELQARFSPALNRRAGQLFSALTGGKYEELTLTREFEAAAREAGGVLPRRTVSLSRGTVDQLYLAVRLAVCELALPAEEPAPLVLDDALSDFDDARMALALECLEQYAGERQILLFTCHGRERAWQAGRG